MKYYLKRLGHQELGSVKNGKAQRGRYIYISKDKNVLVSDINNYYEIITI